MEPEKDNTTTPCTGSETGTDEKRERLSPPPFSSGAGGNRRYAVLQNINKSKERHHWTCLPGQGKGGYDTIWGKTSAESW